MFGENVDARLILGTVAIKGMGDSVVNTGLALLLGAQGVSLTMGVAGTVIGFFGIGVSLVFLMLGGRISEWRGPEPISHSCRSLAR